MRPGLVCYRGSVKSPLPGTIPLDPWVNLSRPYQDTPEATRIQEPVSFSGSET